MAHKTLVGGTAYKVTGGKCLVGGTAYSIKKGRTLVDGTGYDVKFSAYNPVFADNEWAAIIDACQKNEVPSSWVVGDQKSMTINGKEYMIDIIGKGHDDYADGSGKAPLTLQMHDVYVSSYKMNNSATNVGGWGSSVMRATNLPYVLKKMPTEVQAAIREVKKLTSAGNKSTAINTTADKLFLLSCTEVNKSYTYAATGEGSPYAYYAAGNSTIKKKHWWLRSPSTANNSYFCLANTAGSIGGNSAENYNAISFAFCF